MNQRRMFSRALTPAALALLACLVLLGPGAGSAAAFDLTGFAGAQTTPDGKRETQAGARADLTTDLDFSSFRDEVGNIAADGNVRNVYVDLPPGEVGNPTAVPRCSATDLVGPPPGTIPACAPETQVGQITLTFACCGFADGMDVPLPLYNIDPPSGRASRFGLNIFGALILVDGTVRADGTYRIGADSNDIPQVIPLIGAKVELWGVPADPSHDAARRGPECVPGCPSTASPKPFMSNATACATGPQTTYGRIKSWQEPGVFHERQFERDTFGKPMEVTGCGAIEFHPRITVQPTNNRAASPTGVTVQLEVPQNEGPDSLAASHVKEVEVKMPAGMSISPAAANGLEACTPAQIGLGNKELPHCPQASKLGELELETPLLDEPLTGGAYLAKQYDNPFGSLMAMYLTFVNVERGIVIKLPGRVETDPRTGQVTTSFDDNPQLPFSRLTLRLNGGERSTLINPPTCGTYRTESRFLPWSAARVEDPEASDYVSSDSEFVINQGPHGSACPAGDPNLPGNPVDAGKRRFAPKMTAGSVNVQAGAFSSFQFKLKREDDEQEMTSISTVLPEGLIGSLRGVAECSAATIAAIPTAPGTAQAELDRPSCPASSLVGNVNVGAGVGESPYYTTARAYLAGPYKGAPLSLVFVAAAKAGPFDFGNVVVRSQLRIDPVTTQVTVVSDPIPHILEGVPLRVQDIRIDMNRPNFVLNPTSCDPMSFDGLFTGAGWDFDSTADDVLARGSNRFQMAGCAGLGFSPRLALNVKGGTRRGAYQALTSVLTAKPGQANIEHVSVALPSSEFLAQNHIRTVCTRVQYAAAQCPEGSIYGYAKAFSPLLDEPLEGPVYLRSSSHPLPDLVAALRGRFAVDLAGQIDSVRGGIRTTFDLVPDAPVSRFVLTMRGGKRSLLVNSTNLCAAVQRATVRMVGQNGKAETTKPAVSNSCGKKAKKKAHHRPARRAKAAG